MYAHASHGLPGWLNELGVAPPAVRTLPISQVVRDVSVQGPVVDLAPRLR